MNKDVNMKKFHLAKISLVILLASSPVFAAHQAKDKDVYKDTFKDAAPAAYSWTGFYAGVNAGYGWGSQSVKLSSTDIAGGTSVADAIAGNAIPSSLANDPSGWLGGLQIGYNYQIDQYLLGLEADWQWANVDSSKTKSTNLTPTYYAFTTYAQQKLDWLATFRARLGWLASEQLLLYVTGGLGYGDAKVSASITNPGCVGFCANNSSSSNNSGWVAGLGAEYAFLNNWSVKGEYLYYDLGSQSNNLNDAAFPTTPVRSKADFKGNIVRAGINYKFM
jgi:outer membrane immunogenic protein